MKQKRAERIMEALKEMGLRQMLIVDPMSIYYLTGVYVEPFERFYALYLREDGKHVYFLNKLFTVPEDVGVEKVWYSDTDPAAEIVAGYLDKESPLGVDKDLKGPVSAAPYGDGGCCRFCKFLHCRGQDKGC